MVDMKEETSNHIDTKDENTIGGRNNEESSHPSIKDQGTIEEQRYEESLDTRVI
jgi:hypothetical protein